jgi:hypothetical protein
VKVSPKSSPIRLERAEREPVVLDEVRLTLDFDPPGFHADNVFELTRFDWNRADATCFCQQSLRTQFTAGVEVYEPGARCTRPLAALELESATGGKAKPFESQWTGQYEFLCRRATVCRNFREAQRSENGTDPLTMGDTRHRVSLAGRSRQSAGRCLKQPTSTAG